MNRTVVKAFILVVAASAAGSATVSQPIDLPIQVRTPSGVIPLEVPRGYPHPHYFLVTNLGADTLYYDPCSGSVYLDELDPEVPRAFNVGNMDQCVQREPIAPGESVKVDFSVGFVQERMREAGLAPRYRLRLEDYFFRRSPPRDRQGLRKFEDYIRIEGDVFSDPFRFYEFSE